MKKVKIFTNAVYPSWEPTDLENFLGGSEECIVQFAEELARENYDVTVYHSSRIQNDKTHNGVLYVERNKAECNSDDIFITWKDWTPWKNGAQARKNIHWTADIESSWGFNGQTQKLNADSIDAFINISHYQKSKNIFLPDAKNYVIPLGVDIDSLEKNKHETESNTYLYCSSPDRGLLQLLADWKQIKEKFPEAILKVAYGWQNFNFKNFELRRFKNQVDELMKQDEIVNLGSLTKDEIEKEYWKAEYWILPLNNPDSELFCLNAVKAQYCGCTPIVNKLGALSETVENYIPYTEFRQGKTTTTVEPGIFSKALTWSQVYTDYWKEILEAK